MYAGSQSNAPNGVFIRHNFTNYAQANFGSLLVTNNYGITGGRDQETDDDYRYRIHLKLISPSGANQAALQLQLLTVPGIQDVVFDSQAGTFYCYVYAITPLASASVLSAAQNAINNFVAFPLTGAVLNPDLVGISLSTTITLTAGSSATDQSTAVAQAIAAATKLHQQSRRRPGTPSSIPRRISSM
jgi:uncharacterized phage protein gp47/JayE